MVLQLHVAAQHTFHEVKQPDVASVVIGRRRRSKVVIRYVVDQLGQLDPGPLMPFQDLVDARQALARSFSLSDPRRPTSFFKSLRVLRSMAQPARRDRQAFSMA